MATAPNNQQNPALEQRERLEAIGRLASGVAHDFANLVTLITGYSELVLKRMGPQDASRADMEEIRKAADRGARLTAQLLGFTRRNQVRSEPIDLNGLIYEMERMLRYIIGEHIQLRTDCAPDLATVAADRGQIEQIIVNLVLNARDAMPAGGRIDLSTRNTGPGMPPGVLLIVSDTGEGIARENLERVFEPFFTTKENGGGTGLGLSTVRNIVRGSGGAISVASQPGQGAAFTVRLPRAESAAGIAATPGTPKSHRGHETILLVEDESSVRHLLARILRDRGYSVIEAPHAEEALRIASSGAPELDLLLTDLVMPGMSGLELANRLCDLRPGLRVLCMSGYTEEVLTHTGSMNPGMPFLRKPLRPDALAAGVREALDSRPLPFNPR
jgi:CheY-like chemotaxis protein